MIIFWAKDAAAIAEQLHDARSKGAIGVYYANPRDERTVRAAAALAGMKVVVVNNVLVRLACLTVCFGSCLMIIPSTVVFGFYLVLISFLVGFVVFSLEMVGIVKVKLFRRKRL